jgi:hypothetical protein
MCIVQYDPPAQDDAGMKNDGLIPASPLKTNAVLEWITLIASFIGFTLAIFILIYGISQNVTCLPLGCLAKDQHPIIYWLSLLANGTLAILMAYVFACGVRDVRRR